MKKFLLMLIMAMACLNMQTSFAQENWVIRGDTLFTPAIAYYGTGTPLRYTDSLYVVSNEEDNKGILLKDGMELTRDDLFSFVKAVASICLYKGKDEAGNSLKVTNTDFYNIDKLRMKLPFMKDCTGTDIIGISILDRIDNMFTHSKVSSNPAMETIMGTTTLYGGLYTWGHTTFSSSEKKVNTLTIKTSPCVYFTKKDATDKITTPLSLPKGSIATIMPVIRSGYPYDAKKYQGTAVWTITDTEGNVLKDGTFELAAPVADKEYIDTLAHIDGFTTKSDNITLAVKLPDGTELTKYTIPTTDHEHSYSFTHDNDSHTQIHICDYDETCKAIEPLQSKHEFDDDHYFTSKSYRCGQVGCGYVDEARWNKCLKPLTDSLKVLINKCEDVKTDMTDNDWNEVQQEIDKANKFLAEEKIDLDSIGISIGQLNNVFISALEKTALNIFIEYGDKAITELSAEAFDTFYGKLRTLGTKDYIYGTLGKTFKQAAEELLNETKTNISVVNVGEPETKANKYLENGRVVIVKNGEEYNTVGQRIK